MQGNGGIGEKNKGGGEKRRKEERRKRSVGVQQR